MMEQLELFAEPTQTRQRQMEAVRKLTDWPRFIEAQCQHLQRALHGYYTHDLIETEHDTRRRLAKNVIGRTNKSLKSGRRSECSAPLTLGVSAIQAREYLESQFQEGMTWVNRNCWHLDHIRPLMSFDLTDPRQLAEASHISNLQPLWMTDHYRKTSMERQQRRQDRKNWGQAVKAKVFNGELQA
jgi:hypothetical protein